MDLESIEQLMLSAGMEHPSIRDVNLETDAGTCVATDVIKRQMEKGWQPTSNSILEGNYTTFTIHRSKTTLTPATGGVIVDGIERWSIKQVSHAYGGLAYRCACLMQQ